MTSAMRAGVTIIAAKATGNGMQQATGYEKRIKAVKALELKVFKSWEGNRETDCWRWKKS